MYNPVKYTDPSGHLAIGDDIDPEKISQDDVIYWIHKIESEFSFITIVTDPDWEGVGIGDQLVDWTVRELSYIYDVLSWYPYIDQLSKINLYLYRARNEFGSLSTYTTTYMEEYSGVVISIGDNAWRTPATYGVLSITGWLFKTERNFKTSIFHELTHAAIQADKNFFQSGLDQVMCQQNKFLYRAYNWIAYYAHYPMKNYDRRINGNNIWDNPEERKAEEILIFQLTVAYFTIQDLGAIK